MRVEKMLKQSIGKKINYRVAYDRHRGTYIERTSIIKDVFGRNILLENGDYVFYPDLLSPEIVDP